MVQVFNYVIYYKIHLRKTVNEEYPQPVGKCDCVDSFVLIFGTVFFLFIFGQTAPSGPGPPH